MAIKQVGAAPSLPQDTATKAFVEANAGGGSGIVLGAVSDAADLVTITGDNTTAESWFGEGAFVSVVEYTAPADMRGTIRGDFGSIPNDGSIEFYIFATDARVDDSALDVAYVYYDPSRDVAKAGGFALEEGVTYWLTWVVWGASGFIGQAVDRGPIINIIYASEVGLAGAEGYVLTRAHSDGTTEIMPIIEASGEFAWSEGKYTISSGEASHAEGLETIASGDGAHAEGEETRAIARNAHTEGYQTLASADDSHAEGRSTKATGLRSHAEGDNTIASGANAHAEGANSLASGPASHAEGSGQATAANSHAEGAATASGLYSHAEGASTAAVAYESSTGRVGAETSTIPVIADGTTADRFLSCPLRVGGLNVVGGMVMVSGVAASAPIGVWEVKAIVHYVGGTATIIGTPTITLIGRTAAANGYVVTTFFAGTSLTVQVALQGVSAGRASIVFRRDFLKNP